MVKKILTKLRNKLIGEPAKKYRIYRRGDGKYFVKYGEDKYIRRGPRGEDAPIWLFDNLTSALEEIDLVESIRVQQEQDNKITLVKEIKA